MFLTVKSSEPPRTEDWPVRPLNDNASPMMGRDICGPTATVRSVASLDQVHFYDGALFNLRFDPRGVQGEKGIETIEGVIRTYFEEGGQHIQINVVDDETLRKAQTEPENYRGLIVRVAGYIGIFYGAGQKSTGCAYRENGPPAVASGKRDQEMAEMITALVGSIQKYSTEDGPGIRTTVFLKGCPLRCQWCHNPELIDPRQQIILRPSNCIGCGACAETCPRHCLRVENGKVKIDWENCDHCLLCTEVCYAQAVSSVAAPMTVEDINESR